MQLVGEKVRQHKELAAEKGGKALDLSGTILEEFGHVPTAGESLEHTGVRIDILEASDTQVTRARLTKLTPLDQEAPA